MADDHRWIALRDGEVQPVPYSPLGPLTREELEIIDIPANTLMLAELLPNKRFTVGQTWSVADRTLARLLCLDVVHQANVKGTLKSVDKSVAVLYYEGTVQGSANGVATELEVLAKANFDLAQHYISWLNLAIKENRAVGHAEPGYEVVSKIGVALRRLPAPKKLTPQNVATLPLTDEPITDLQFKSKGSNFQFMLDRRWRVMTDQEQITVLRLVDRGDLIAQCNVSVVEGGEAGKFFSLEEFQQDVHDSLGNAFQEFAEASQNVTDDGIRVLRLVALGQSMDVPVEWIYYHFTDRAGHQAAMVFTLELSLVERFGELDRAITSSFQFAGASDTQPAESSEEARSAKEKKVR